MEWFCRIAPGLSGWTCYVDAFNIMNDFITKFVDSRIANHQPDARRDFTDIYIDEMLKTKDVGSSFGPTEGSKPFFVFFKIQ